MRNRGLLDDPTIVDIAKRYDKTPAQIVLRWHLAHNRIYLNLRHQNELKKTLIYWILT